MLELILSFALSFVFLMLAMTIHESAHAWVAHKLGDDTARYSGRLTLNPIVHIDPFWTFLFPLIIFISTGGRFIFGAAKPVPINYLALRNPKRDIIWIGASGPLANFIFAFLLSSLLKLITMSPLVDFTIKNLIVINVILGVLNLIPIPPLDGSRILIGILPKDLAYRYAFIEPYGFIIMILLIWMGIIGQIVWPAVHSILKVLGVSF